LFRYALIKGWISPVAGTGVSFVAGSVSTSDLIAKVNFSRLAEVSNPKTGI
jgi:hypothetical protein